MEFAKVETVEAFVRAGSDELALGTAFGSKFGRKRPAALSVIAEDSLNVGGSRVAGHGRYVDAFGNADRDINNQWTRFDGARLGIGLPRERTMMLISQVGRDDGDPG